MHTFSFEDRQYTKIKTCECKHDSFFHVRDMMHTIHISEEGKDTQRERMNSERDKFKVLMGVTVDTIKKLYFCAHFFTGSAYTHCCVTQKSVLHAKPQKNVR